MENQPLHIKFQNQQNPTSGFDIIALEDLFKRTNLDHNPYDHHLVEFFIILFIKKGHGKHSIDFTDYGNNETPFRNRNAASANAPKITYQGTRPANKTEYEQLAWRSY